MGKSKADKAEKKSATKAKMEVDEVKKPAADAPAKAESKDVCAGLPSSNVGRETGFGVLEGWRGVAVCHMK